MIEFFIAELPKVSYLGARIPVSTNNLVTCLAWAFAEGGWQIAPDPYNPLNTTEPESGSWSINSVGVRGYISLAQGEAATAATMEDGYFDAILAGLEHSTDPYEMASVIGASQWGTSGLTITETIPRAEAAIAAYLATRSAPKPAPMEEPMNIVLVNDPNGGVVVLNLENGTFQGEPNPTVLAFYQKCGVKGPIDCAPDVFAKFKPAGTV